MGNKNQIIRDLRNQVNELRGVIGDGKAPQTRASVVGMAPPSASAPSGDSPLQGQLVNSLTTLAANATMQSQLTSLAPIIQNNVYYPVTLNYMALMYMYKTHGVLQTAIDMPVLDAFRGGLDFSSRELSVEDLEDFQDWLEEKRILGVFADAVIWKRLFGGGALVVNAKVPPGTALHLAKIKADGLEFYDACRWELSAPSMEADEFKFYGVTIPKDRVLVMPGKRAPYIIRNQLSGWGMSEMERMVSNFNLYLQTDNVLYEILDEAKIDVYKLDGYQSLLSTAEGTAMVNTRLSATNQLKNFHNALILDKEDEYDQKQLSFSGLAEIKKENRIGIASALRMPITKLFGLSATGFNSGEDDIENYNAMVESEVREPARPQLRQVLKLCVRAFFGDDYDFDFKFKPLRMMTSAEEEQIKSSKTTRILNLYNAMLLSSQEVGEICQKEGLLPIDTAMARGELEEHPVAPGMEGEVGGAGGAEDGGEDAAAGDWHMSPSGKMRRKLKSGRYEYRKPGAKPQAQAKDGSPKKATDNQKAAATEGKSEEEN